jgi:hypothetical protein
VRLECERVYLELCEVIAIVFGGREDGFSDPCHLALSVQGFMLVEFGGFANGFFEFGKGGGCVVDASNKVLE